MSDTSSPPKFGLRGFFPVLLLFPTLIASAAGQSFTADFSKWSTEPPLVKSKFGVYQTPLIKPRTRMLQALDLLREVEPQEFRYEAGWGKNDALDFDQIGGTAQNLTFDFRSIDEIAEKLKAADVRLLLAMAYCPNPLKPRGQQTWPHWKDIPADLGAFGKVSKAYAARLDARMGPNAAWCEIWNEPDMPQIDGKMFFNGNANDYKNLYLEGAPEVKAGSVDTAVGGGAVAFDVSYFDSIKTVAAPIDFTSIHAYANYADHLNQLRSRVNSGEYRRLPMLLTEYNSYESYGLSAPISKASGAMNFFKDVKGLLGHADTPIVHWAQWADRNMGMLYWDGTGFRRKAIFNAYKIYQTMLPTDRAVVSPGTADGVNTLAGSDSQRAGIVAWNESNTEKTVTLRLDRLPFPAGTLQLFRIDPRHASYCDSAVSENLSPENLPAISGGGASWTGNIPAQSLVFLQAADGAPTPPAPRSLGTFVKSLYWYEDRSKFAGATPLYADFDRRTWTARLGMGGHERGVSIIGTVIDNPAQNFQLSVRTEGRFGSVDKDSLFGLRIDFQGRDGRFNRSVLVHGGLFDKSRSWEVPWGKKGATADRIYRHPGMKNGGNITMDLSKLAPADWNRKRVIFTWILQNAGPDSRAIIHATPTP